MYQDRYPSFAPWFIECDLSKVFRYGRDKPGRKKPFRKRFFQRSLEPCNLAKTFPEDVP